MRLGDIMVARGMVTLEQVSAAIDRQNTEGGRLGDSLIALGHMTPEQVEQVLVETPRTPKTALGTGISIPALQNLLLKFMFVEQIDSTHTLADAMKLPPPVIQHLLKDLEERKFVQAMSSTSVGVIADTRYELSQRGRDMAQDALERSLYMGPAPVALRAYQDQILRQKISNERLDEAAFREVFKGLIIPDHFFDKVGPAVNSGKTMLLYGPPGNGKTSVATQVAKIFKHVIFVPYAVEIEGQIMQVYDATVHELAVDKAAAAQLARQSRGLRKDDFDLRWIPIKRPIVVVGGELTMEMLDLQYSDDAKFYEAPMHVKALGGTFIIDDFGRQLVSPEALLNRWIVPMESRVDYFKLKTGKSFQIPFDELLIFSTNLQPEDLMDAAFLRRIAYKIELYEPTEADFRTIFHAAAQGSGLEIPEDLLDFTIAQLKANNYELSYFQPKFIIDQVKDACKYQNVKPHFDQKKIIDGLKNLYVHLDVKLPDSTTGQATDLTQ